MNEDLKALLEQFEISEETVEQLSEMINTAVSQATEEVTASLQESHDQEISDLVEQHGEEIAQLKEHANNYGQSIYDDLLEQVNGYADYVAQEFIKENSEALAKTEEILRMQEAFAVIKEAFEMNGFNVNENAALDVAKAELNEANAEYQKVFEELKEARNQIDSLKRSEVFNERTKDLSATDVERVIELAEAVEFETLEQYTRGIELIVENVTSVGSDEGNPENLNEGATVLEESASRPANPQMDKYVAALRRLSQ